MAKRKKHIAPLPPAASESRSRSRLLFALDIGLLVLAVAFIVGIFFSFLTRPLISYSVTADVGMASCRFGQYLVFEGDQFVDRAPHFHLDVLSMVTSATLIRGLEPPSNSPTANSYAPLG